MRKLETEKDIAEFLCEAALAFADMEGEEIAIRTFGTAGVMTPAQGFVLRAGKSTGPHFQVTITTQRR